MSIEIKKNYKLSIYITIIAFFIGLVFKIVELYFGVKRLKTSLVYLLYSNYFLFANFILCLKFHLRLISLSLHYAKIF